MAFYSVRSERLLCEQLDYNLLYRWFLDMDKAEERIDHSTFSRNRARLLEHEVAARFLAEIVALARAAKLMSDDHCTVDGTLIEAWAGVKSFRPKGEDPADRKPPDDPGNPTVNFHGEKRSNETHESTTDPEAKLTRKGNNQPATLSYLANALMENRNGLIEDLRVEPATGFGERDGDARRARRRQRGRNARRRRRLRRRIICSGPPRAGHHAAHRANPGQSAPLGGRRQNHQALRICGQPAHPETGRGDLRLDEDRRLLPEDQTQRPGPHAARRPPGRRRLQPASDSQTDGRAGLRLLLMGCYHA
jgi:hypothetical protein